MSESTASRLSPEAAAHALRSISLPDVFGPAEIAPRIGVSERAIRRALARGRLPGRRIGRRWAISRLALIAWLAERDDGARGPRLVEGGGRG